MKYAVNETFYTFQGEGRYTGQPAFFIRLHGCPIQCHFCDSAGTWHPDHVPADVMRLDEKEIAARISYEAPIVVLTGGEPAMWDLEPLCCQILKMGKRVHIETSGAFPLRGDFQCVTVSPKRAQEPIVETLRQATELKFIIEKEADINYFTNLCKNHVRWDVPIYLHPEWSLRRNHDVLTAITKAVKSRTHYYLAGWQIHKQYRADDLDANSRRPVPLGGDITKGY